MAQRRARHRRPSVASARSFAALLFLLALGALGVAAFPAPRAPRPATALSAGGGFGAKAPPRPKRTQKQSQKKPKRSGLLETAPPPAPAAPLLDRFGLPPPTEDDVFPPLGPEVPRTAVDAADDGRAFDREEIAAATREHLGVNLDAFEAGDGGGAAPWSLRLLHRDPPVFAIDGFFSEEECAEYAALVEEDGGDGDGTIAGRPRAVRVASPTFSAQSISKRTSTTWFCRYEGVPTLLAKARHLLNVDVGRMEEPQVVRYRTGEEFSFHYDEVPTAQLGNGGQRVATLLVYLNDLGEGRGGGTVFRDLEAPRTEGGKGKKGRGRRGPSGAGAGPLTVRPKAGTALLFFPAHGDGAPDVRTLHKGEVALDTKTIAQLWIHEREYKASVPEGNRQGDAAAAVAEAARRLGFS